MPERVGHERHAETAGDEPRQRRELSRTLRYLRRQSARGTYFGHLRVEAASLLDLHGDERLGLQRFQPHGPLPREPVSARYRQDDRLTMQRDERHVGRQRLHRKTQDTKIKPAAAYVVQ